MDQNPLTNQDGALPQPQTPAKVSFWKSKDPAIIIVRILIYIFVGLPLIAIIMGIILVVLSSARR